jgi:hypothetical protein
MLILSSGDIIHHESRFDKQKRQGKEEKNYHTQLITNKRSDDREHAHPAKSIDQPERESLIITTGGHASQRA